MGQLGVLVFHAARHHIGNRALYVKFEAEFAVHSSEDRIQLFAAPDFLEVFKFLQFHSSDPLEELFRVGQLFVHVG